MRRFLVIGGLAGLLMVSLPNCAAAKTAPVWDFRARLRAAQAAGEIDEGRADLYRLYALKAPERLPPEYRTDTAATSRLQKTSRESATLFRCGTPLLRAIRARFHTLSAAVRTEVEALLGSPRQTSSAPVAHLLPYWIVTTNFSIEWGPDLTNEDGSTPPRDDDGTGIPDVVELWASLFEASYREELESMGFDHPSLSDSIVSVYIGNSDPAASVENIGGSTYAFTVSDDPVPYIVVNNDLRFVPINRMFQRCFLING